MTVGGQKAEFAGQPGSPAGWAHRFIRLPAVVLLLLVLTGCSLLPFRRTPAPPGRTTFSSPFVMLPAQRIGSFLIIETKGNRNGPYRFLIDTGSSVTLAAPALVGRQPARHTPLPGTPRVRVAGADGRITELPSATLRLLELGDARFENVPVLVYDCAPLSAHLGVRIDGVLGFPLFREARLTLDYPGSRVLLQPVGTIATAPGTAIAFDGERRTPFVRVGLGERSLVALIDSGSDAAFSLNPVGLEARFVQAPRVGGTVGTIAGEHRQRIARLDGALQIGKLTFAQPIVELTEDLSAIGAGLLRHFTVTFDQENNRVTFHRHAPEPILFPPLRSAGLSFTKTPAYWRIASVVPGSPAEAAGIREGDLVTRIDGEHVARWDLNRFEQRVAEVDALALTLLAGANETAPRWVKVFELVP